MSRAQTLSLIDVRLDRYDQGRAPVRLLDIDALVIPAGFKIGIAGPSGAGKTTLLDIASGLLTPTTGRVTWGDKQISGLRAGADALWRRLTLGFIFQDFHLLSELSVLDNILLPAWFGSFRAPTELQGRARELALRLRLPDMHRPAGVLSRGEQQRVAIARALLHDAALIIADEPTANLDAVNGAEIINLLITEAERRKATLLVATHDATLLARLDQVIHLKDGRIGVIP
jgi:ABC-type lipoprotein export system ATPase subunit